VTSSRKLTFRIKYTYKKSTIFITSFSHQAVVDTQTVPIIRNVEKRLYRSPAPTIATKPTTPANTPSWSFGAAPDLKVASVLEEGELAFGDGVVELAGVAV
jgi:hypothetical protein